MSAADAPRRQLGRGLSALLGDTRTEAATGEAAAAQRGVKLVPVGQIHAGRAQPRKHFDDDEMAELIASVRTQGLLQPVLLRRDPVDPARFELVAGERRWRAAQAAQLHEIPALVKDLNDREALEAALVENLQRQDLSALEEASAYQRLVDEFGHTQEKIAEALGKSRPHVANTIRLLELPDEVKAWLNEGKLTPGHARLLVAAEDPIGLAQKIVNLGLTVRQAEKLVAEARATPKKKKLAKRGAGKDADTRALERQLTETLGLRVNIAHKPGSQKGSLTIEYDSLDQLDNFLALLQR
jgi:ParB family transcriptional regulator, chromosome partitioning protein